MEGKTQETAATMAGMSVRSARKWQSGPLQSETKQERWWRTRSDPFDGVWEEEIEPFQKRLILVTTYSVSLTGQTGNAGIAPAGDGPPSGLRPGFALLSSAAPSRGSDAGSMPPMGPNWAQLLSG